MQHHSSVKLRATGWTPLRLFHVFKSCSQTAPHPVLRSVTRSRLVESSPTRPFRTTLDSKGRSSGEMRCSATSGDTLFILSTAAGSVERCDRSRRCFT